MAITKETEPDRTPPNKRRTSAEAGGTRRDVATCGHRVALRAGAAWPRSHRHREVVLAGRFYHHESPCRVDVAVRLRAGCVVDRRSHGWHDDGALMWSWPATLAVSGLGVVLIGVAVVLWTVGAPGEPPAVLGAVALIVAGSGRITTASRLRYGDRPLPPVPDSSAVVDHAAVRPRRRSRATRRSSGIAYVWMVITGGGVGLAAAVNWTRQPLVGNLLEAASAVACTAFCYLAGPAARFVVTPQHLHIETALRRISVPRHLLDGFTRGRHRVRLHLTNGDHLDFRVDSGLWDIRGGAFRSNPRCQARTVERIVALLGEVPGNGGTEQAVVVTVRRGTTAIAVAAGLVLLAGTVGLAVAVATT